MKRYLLDTQPFIMLAHEKEVKKIGRKALRIIEDEHSQLMLSTISLVEISVKNQVGKLEVSQAAIDNLIDRLDLTVLSFTSEHAKAFHILPLHHKEPFDRMLIATALTDGLPILSGDEIFARYKGLRVVW